MPEEPEKEIIDIEDQNKIHTAAGERLNGLYSGFHALSLDYSYHIQNTWGGHKIDELRDNVLYRLFSSLFHCELLLREHNQIEKRLSQILANNPDKILAWVYPKNRHYEYAERQVSSIFDSIVFHAASIFDYMSILITFISLKDRDQTPMWGQTTRSARDRNNELHQKPVAKAIDRVDKDFVTRLYNHRSELIHRRADIVEHGFLIKPSTGKFTVRFLCSPKIRKTFKTFGEADKDYTLAYFSYWIVNTASGIIADLLLDLKADIVSNPPLSRHDLEKDGTRPILLGLQPGTNRAISPSATAWSNFQKYFPSQS